MATIINEFDSDFLSMQDHSSGSSVDDESISDEGPFTPLETCLLCQREHESTVKCQVAQGYFLDAPSKRLFESKRMVSIGTPIPSKPHCGSPAIGVRNECLVPPQIPNAAIYKAAVSQNACVYAIFGGQGNSQDYLSEFRQLFNAHRSVIENLVSDVSEMLQQLSRSPKFADHYSNGFDLMAWLEDESTSPDNSYLISAPVSLPLIGLLQLLHLRVLGHQLRCSPLDMQRMLSGTTGHSQGIISAAVLASASSWSSFEQKVIDGVTILQSMGARAHQVFPPTSLPPSIIQDSEDNGEGLPSPMLSIQGLSLEKVRKYVQEANEYLGDSQLEVGLVNGLKRVVVCGPPACLHSLSVRLRSQRASADQTRIVHSQRKQTFHLRYLPVTAPFHSTYLADAAQMVADDVKDISFNSSGLSIPLYSTADGKDLRASDKADLLPYLIGLILHKPLNWESATEFPNATTVLDFGPGGASGVGALVNRNKEGQGVRVILTGVNEGRSSNFGYKEDILGEDVSFNNFVSRSWEGSYRPSLVRTAPERTIVDTRFSRLIGLPPVMVAGMTPTTSSADFVLAVMNAGYHVELAAGGLHSAEDLSEAVHKIAGSMGPARGITINVIYATPRHLSWQIPTIKKLREEGLPIEGLTVGAGVPSIDVAGEYIRNLGLRHIGFKPGSLFAIEQVVAIAKANPMFPIILQWTGGRGGGHHSFEDFHQPLLEMYGQIRECNNISLVVGSGLGDAEDSYPYLSGRWSESLGFPTMPCDGVLLGSRVMVARETRTSQGAKQAIVDAPGLADEDWESTYQRPSGGVLTVKSEMGEPIHKIATRLVKFWKELDNTVFSLKKAGMMQQLQDRRDYIIDKLNKDCHKVWFGKDSMGGVVEVDEMTYEELLNRVIELTFVKHQRRWIHVSFQTLVEDIMTLSEARFSSEAQQRNIANEPERAVQQLLASYPRMADELVTYKDSRKFIEMCRRKGQKAVPFIPILDENFEMWFKKDSLWQSEDLDAVIDQDAGRVCILQGPVAVRYSKVVDEPIKSILDGIHVQHVSKLTSELYSGKEEEAPFIECFGISSSDPNQCLKPRKSTMIGPEHVTTYDFAAEGLCNLPSIEALLNTLGGPCNNWKRAFFTTENIIQGTQLHGNPIRRIYAPSYNTSIMIRECHGSAASVALFEHQSSVANKVAEVLSDGNGTIDLQILDHHANPSKPATLHLQYTYQPESNLAPIREVMEGRNDSIRNFYRQIWFDGETDYANRSVHDEYRSGRLVVSSDDIVSFTRSVSNFNDAFTKRGTRRVAAPMDYSIKLAWKSIVMPLFAVDLDCDLLKLVHLSNGFEMIDNATPLIEGDVVEAVTRVIAIVNQASGKLIRIQGHILRDGKPAIKLSSEFLVRGVYGDHENTFESLEHEVDMTLSSPEDIAVLKSKEWFLLVNRSCCVLDARLRFCIKSNWRFDESGNPYGLEVLGEAYSLSANTRGCKVASVQFSDESATENIVLDYLKRHGSAAGGRTELAYPIPQIKKEQAKLRIAPSNEKYAQASGDRNPIHVNRTISRYVELPGTITHGMNTSAIIRGLVERWVCENDIGLFRSFNCNFTAMVLPNDELEVSFEHTAMLNGGKIISVRASKVATQEPVLLGEAHILPPPTAYVFTGQGSQRQNMGMDLYASSSAARKVWDVADSYFLATYGFSIISIVKNNPRELVIHFGGARGRALRKNYMALSILAQDLKGEVVIKKAFPTIDDDSHSYTFSFSEGLLFATQFAQPALTLMEKAIFEDLLAKGLVSEESSFAGHSLGEYAALCSMGGGVLSLASLVELAFYRGMSMAVAVPRDARGRSNYTMIAADPSRVGSSFNQNTLDLVVGLIRQNTDNALLEIVNYNIRNAQYVCAGELASLDCLAYVLDTIKTQQIRLADLPLPDAEAAIQAIVSSYTKPNGRIELKRGLATIPLPGIDVPFHSSYLSPGVNSFRSVLRQYIKTENVDIGKLAGKYVPNLVAEPFQVDRRFVERVHNKTGSGVLGTVVERVSPFHHPTGR